MPKVKIITEQDCFESEEFMPVKRVNYLQYQDQLDSLRELVTDYCVGQGKPLVIENMDQSINWDAHLFSINQLEAHATNIVVPVMALRYGLKRNVSLADYLHDLRVLNQKSGKKTNTSSKRKVTSISADHTRKKMIAEKGGAIRTFGDGDEDNSDSHVDQEDQQMYQPDMDSGSSAQVPESSSSTNRVKKDFKLEFNISQVYAKDVPCPVAYRNQLDSLVPNYLSPLGSDDLFTYTPQKLKAENLMCYIGQNSTGTPVHRDICGTMGHNIMLYGEENAYSEWIIVEHKYRDKLAEILHPPIPETRATHASSAKKKAASKSSFLESDRAWLTSYLIKKSGLKCHIITQRPGDFVIIPSRAYHQVRNVGLSVKIAWNRTTAISLGHSFNEQLPLYKMINRPEVYKCKAMVYSTLQAWYRKIRESKGNLRSIDMYDESPAYFMDTVKHLLDLFVKHVIYPEWIETIQAEAVDEAGIAPDTDNVFEIVCDFCHADVFSKYYHCKTCDEYDLCTNCYAKGRSCRHPLTMQMVQNTALSVDDCIDLYNNIIDIINQNHDNDNAGSKEILEKKWHSYLKDQLDNKQYSLATVCRRIERYRKVKKNRARNFNCVECDKNFTILKLSKKGYQLEDIFKQRREEDDIEETISYYCTDCEKLHPERQALTPDDTYNDIDLVYYLLPSHDTRNRGGALDYDVSKQCTAPLGSR